MSVAHEDFGRCMATRGIKPEFVPNNEWATLLHPRQSMRTHDRDTLPQSHLSLLLSHQYTLRMSIDSNSDTVASPLASNTIHIHQVLCTAGLYSYNNYANG